MLLGSAPLLAVRMFRGPLYPRMPVRQQQRRRRTDLCLDNAKIPRGIENTRIPDLPARQAAFYLLSERLHINQSSYRTMLR